MYNVRARAWVFPILAPREEDDDGPEERDSTAAGAPTGWLVRSTDGRPATKGETKGKARRRRRLTKERHDADENPLRKESAAMNYFGIEREAKERQEGLLREAQGRRLALEARAVGTAATST